VYIINSGEFVFKFPRSEEIKEQYKLEVAAYKLASQIETEIAIPNVKWEHPNLDYFGYKGILGDRLELSIENLTGDDRKLIGRQIGGFLKQLHELNLTEAPFMTLEKEIEQFTSKYQLSLPEIEKNFSPPEQEELASVFLKHYPSEILRLGIDKGFCHGDLGYWNIIYGTDGQLGIIDFGDIGYYDRSKDFIGINEEDVLNSALEKYGARDSLKEKVNLRRKILPILDLPYFIGKSNQEGIQRTIKRIRNTLLH
jgi:aminoglycoside phosphotransferase